LNGKSNKNLSAKLPEVFGILKTFFQKGLKPPEAEMKLENIMNIEW
jgi:hypothetical protein